MKLNILKMADDDDTADSRASFHGKKLLVVSFQPRSRSRQDNNRIIQQNFSKFNQISTNNSGS